MRFDPTYITDTLVEMGQRIAAAFLDGERFGWIPYLILWMGLAGGGLAGAFTSSTLGVGSLWIAAAPAASLAIVAAWLDPDQPETRPGGAAASAE